MNATLAPSLSAADRCDRCGAQAYIRARLVNGGELYFCEGTWPLSLQVTGDAVQQVSQVQSITS